MATYNNGSEIEPGDFLVCTSGHPDSWDWGQIDAVDGDEVTVSWFGSQTGLTQDASVVAGCTPFASTGRQWARREFELARIALDAGTGPRSVC